MHGGSQTQVPRGTTASADMTACLAATDLLASKRVHTGVAVTTAAPLLLLLASRAAGVHVGAGWWLRPEAPVCWVRQVGGR